VEIKIGSFTSYEVGSKCAKAAICYEDTSALDLAVGESRPFILPIRSRAPDEDIISCTHDTGIDDGMRRRIGRRKYGPVVWRVQKTQC
jgi:hypothetical protein